MSIELYLIEHILPITFVKLSFALSLFKNCIEVYFKPLNIFVSFSLLSVVPLESYFTKLFSAYSNGCAAPKPS